MEDKENIVSGLTELLFFLAFECYSEDKERQDKIVRMATAVRNAINTIEGKKE